MRALLRRTLHLDGRFEVVGEAADGAEAIAVVTELRPDLVILDIPRPKLAGISALPGLRAASPATTIVMLSGLPAQDMERASVAGGAVGYIEKGEDISTLP